MRTFAPPALRLVALTTVLAGFAAVAAPAAGATWTTHRDPAGYIVDVPSGWTLRYDAPHHKVSLTAADGARVVLRVVTANQSLDADQGTSVGEALVKDADSGVRWSEGEIESPAIAIISSRNGPRIGTAYFTWASSHSLSVGYLYAQSGARSVLAHDKATIARIYQSFRLVQPAASATATTTTTGASPGLRYTRFVEPTEHMFTVELPVGWTQAGGLYRQSLLDFRPAFRASQAGRAVIQSGDSSIPFFEVPNQMLQMGGFREGTWYQAGPGARLLVNHYIDGTSFARQYAASHFRSACANLQMANARPRQDAVAAVNATYAQYGLPGHLSAGEVAFTCTLDGREMHGYVFAGTQLQMMNGSGIWNVPLLLSYFATPQLLAQAHEALDHAVATYQVDPAWAERNSQAAKNISAITTRTGHEISKIISDTYWSTTETRDAALARYDRGAVRGHQLATDPVTHTTMEIDDRYAYNFIDRSGNIAGSDVNAAPGPDFRALIMHP